MDYVATGARWPPFRGISGAGHWRGHAPRNATQERSSSRMVDRTILEIEDLRGTHYCDAKLRLKASCRSLASGDCAMKVGLWWTACVFGLSGAACATFTLLPIGTPPTVAHAFGLILE